MGASLVANILEIEKGREPDWQAAERHLMAASDDDLAKVVGRLLNHRFEVADDEDDADRSGDAIDGMKEAILKALESVIDCWHGASRNAIKYEAATTVILIVGGTTVGEPFEELDDVEAFVASGMARAAGFIVEAQ